MHITEGTAADCGEAIALINGIDAEHLLADKAYDTNEIINYSIPKEMVAVIPPKKSRKEPRGFNKALYKHCHLVEHAFLHLKRWRGVATRYAKNASSFLAAVHIRCVALWAKIL